MHADSAWLLAIAPEEHDLVAMLDRGPGAAPLTLREDSPGVLLAAIKAHAGERGMHAAAALDDAPTSLLREGLPTLGRLWVCHSWEAEMAGALGGRPGVLVHSGLGAAASVVSLDGATVRVQQSEEMLGEEGSALWLGTRALRMAVQGSVGRMQRSERLERALQSYFGAETLMELVSRFDHGEIERDEMAGFVSVVLHLGDYPDPDPACRGLLLQASRRLAHLVRMGMEQAQVSSHARGSWSGAAMHGALLAVFREDVERLAPGVSWGAPRRGAAEGALMLARSARACDAEAEQPVEEGRTEQIGPDVWRRLFVGSES